MTTTVKINVPYRMYFLFTNITYMFCLYIFEITSNNELQFYLWSFASYYIIADLCYYNTELNATEYQLVELEDENVEFGRTRFAY